MTFKAEQIKELSAPLSTAHVKKNPRGFDYVEAWHAIAEANRIFGFDAWNRETVEIRQLGEPRVVGNNTRIGYMAKVRITVGSIVREGCGFGQGINSDVDMAHESALKEAESDAMKRALMTFGNPFGLALYDKAKANVVDAPAPRSRKTPAQAKRDGDHEKYLAEFAKLDHAGAQDWLAHFDEYTADAPPQWLDALRDKLEIHIEGLKGADNVSEANAQMDEAFRGTMGGGRPAGLPRNGSAVEAA